MIDTIINSFEIWTNAQGIKSRTRINSIDNISLEGIARLRELIMDLAITGKLVPQDPKEEPADVLLKKIEKEKEKLVKEGKISKQKKQFAISDEFKQFKIPKCWIWVRLNDIGNIFNGNSIDSATKESKYSNNDGIPYIATKDVGYAWDILDYNNGISIPEDERNFRMAHKGSVLICAEGGSAGKKCGITNRDIFFGNKLFAIELFGNIPSNYILTNYLSSIFSRQFKSKLTGIIGGISIQKFNEIIIPLAPLSEQKRIVAKVDELMALCDKLENEQFKNLKTHEVLVKSLLETLTEAADANELQAAWKRMSTHFDTLFCTEDSINQLKQTILQLAVMGKLVKQDPIDEEASDLLKKIEKEKNKLVEEKKLKKQKPLPKITEEAKPFLIPKSWLWVPWGSILAYDDYPFKRGPFGSSLKKDMFIESGYKVYEQYCPINDDCSFERYYISDELYKNLEGFAVKAGDYLVSCSGATLGRITQVPDDFKEGIINQALLRVRMNHKYIDKDFFKLLFRSPYFQKMIFDNSTGSAIPNVKGVNELKIMPVPFLPIEEQRKIVKKIDELYKICNNLKERILLSQKIKGVLSKTIVEKAVL